MEKMFTIIRKYPHFENIRRSTQMGGRKLFENKLSKYFLKIRLNGKFRSSALILALKVMNLKNGSEIITPCLNFGTAVSSIMLSNCVPVLVDCKDTLQIDEDKIEEKTQKTKAILVPNYWKCT